MKYCTIALCIALAFGIAAASDGCTTSSDYEYLAFVQQWPPTQCAFHTCTNSSIDFFTVHGLWPSNNDGSYPCYCTSQDFSPSKVDSIKDSLDKFWPSFQGSNDDFWSHEYEKHGTCAEDIYYSEYDFFSGTLKVRSQFDVAGALSRHSIYPSNSKTYKLDDFHSALKAEFGASGAIQCDYHDNGINQITLCLNKNLKAIECPSSQSDSCSGSYVKYPQSGSSATLRGARN